LFSIKAIKCPLVNAPFARVYYESVTDAQLMDEYTIRFNIKEPYFLNETMLGGIDVLPRHYYDPQNLLKDVTVKDLNGDPAKLTDNVKRFADHFNKGYSRNPMGSGPYKFQAWKTGQEVELVRDPKYWGIGKPEVDQAYLDRHKYRVINNVDAALTSLKSGALDTMNLQPLQHMQQTSTDRFKQDFDKHEYFSPITRTNGTTITRFAISGGARDLSSQSKTDGETILFNLG
jgi:peptide/nickel transport system substrate-binding protein